jgi:hypothetical protein
MDYGFNQAQLSLKATLEKFLPRTVRRGITQRLICSDSCGLAFEDIHSCWQTFLCYHFPQPVFKSVIFFLWIPKLGRKAVKGCIWTRRQVFDCWFVTPAPDVTERLYHTRFAMVTLFLWLRRRRFVCEWRHNQGFHGCHGYRVCIVVMPTPRSHW